MAVLLVNILDDRLDGVGVVEVDVVHLERLGDLGDLGAELVLDTVLAVQDHRNCALASKLQRDALANALEAASDENNLALKMKIHDVLPTRARRLRAITDTGPRGKTQQSAAPAAVKPRRNGRRRIAATGTLVWGSAATRHGKRRAPGKTEDNRYM